MICRNIRTCSLSICNCNTKNHKQCCLHIGFLRYIIVARLEFELDQWQFKQVYSFINVFLFKIYHLLSIFDFSQKEKYMQRDRQAIIKSRKEENKKLEEQTKKMEAELEKVRRLKEIQNEKLRLKKELEALNIHDQEEINEVKVQVKQEQNPKLRDYGNKVTKQNQVKVKKTIPKFKVAESSSEGQDDDGQNLKYFLKVMGMQNYFQAFKANKILTLPKLRNLKQGQLKAMNIPIKDHVKIIKKIREMGF